MKHEKPGKAKKSKPKKDRDHLRWVASRPCSVCGSWPVQVHHIRILGEPRDDKKTIPLCYDHHQGPNGIHGLGKHAWRKVYGHELDMLDKLLLTYHMRDEDETIQSNGSRDDQ